MSNITYTNKDKTATDGIINKWRDVDCNEVKTAVNSKLDVTIYSGYTGTTLTALNSKVSTTLFNVFTGTTAPATYVNKTIFNSFSATTNTSLSGKVSTTLFNGYSANTLTLIDNRVSQTIFNVYTGTTAVASFVNKAIFNIYTGTTAPATFANKAIFNAYTASTVLPPKVIQLAVSDETTVITSGTSKITFRMPFAMTLTSVRASLGTAQTSGNTVVIDINEGGSSILSTKLSFDNNEKTTTTALIPVVISDTILADDAEITIDIDRIGNSTAKGLKVTLIGL